MKEIIVFIISWVNEGDQICKIVNCMCSQKKIICMNDTDNICHFNDKRAILEAFEKILPDNNNFEK